MSHMPGPSKQSIDRNLYATIVLDFEFGIFGVPTRFYYHSAMTDIYVHSVNKRQFEQ